MDEVSWVLAGMAVLTVTGLGLGLLALTARALCEEPD